MSTYRPIAASVKTEGGRDKVIVMMECSSQSVPLKTQLNIVYTQVDNVMVVGDKVTVAYKDINHRPKIDFFKQYTPSCPTMSRYDTRAV